MSSDVRVICECGFETHHNCPLEFTPARACRTCCRGYVEGYSGLYCSWECCYEACIPKEKT